MTFHSFPRPTRPCRDDKEARVAASSINTFVHASTLLSDGHSPLLPLFFLRAASNERFPASSLLTRSFLSIFDNLGARSLFSSASQSFSLIWAHSSLLSSVSVASQFIVPTPTYWKLSKWRTNGERANQFALNLLPSLRR